MSLSKPMLVCSWKQRNKESAYDEHAPYEWPSTEPNAPARPSGWVNDSSDDRSNYGHARLDASSNLLKQYVPTRLANAPNS